MKETFIIIGEGPTEYFFLNSLKDEFRSMQNISPQYPKHTSMVELELIIKNAIEQGYNHSNEVEVDLSKECGYIKTTDFFRKHPLHQHLRRTHSHCLCG